MGKTVNKNELVERIKYAVAEAETDRNSAMSETEKAFHQGRIFAHTQDMFTAMRLADNKKTEE